VAVTEPAAPPRLAPGDCVAVIAPAGPVPKDAFEAGIARLRQRYRVEHEAGVLSREGYLAGSDERRAAEISRWLGDPKIKALICVRGGYGVTRILPRLDDAQKQLARSPKAIVGFSDATALLFWALQADVRAVHGPVVSQLGKLPEPDVESLFRLLEDPTPPPPVSGLSAGASAAAGRASGRLMGGNLEVLTRLAGTRWQPRLDGAVLLLEEVGERPYRIDRMLTHLGQAGVLRGVAAAIVGDLVSCEEPDRAWPGQPSPSGLEAMRAGLAELGIPALHGLPVGHGTRNLALPLGARVEIDFQAGTLTFLEGAVS
jgi:muramoyltetrapeptide carboxypeptidase